MSTDYPNFEEILPTRASGDVPSVTLGYSQHGSSSSEASSVRAHLKTEELAKLDEATPFEEHQRQVQELVHGQIKNMATTLDSILLKAPIFESTVLQRRTDLAVCFLLLGDNQNLKFLLEQEELHVKARNYNTYMLCSADVVETIKSTGTKWQQLSENARASHYI